MSQHRLAQPGQRTSAIALPGDVVVLAAGCYVESVGLAEASTRAIAAVAYGVGAIGPEAYSLTLAEIDRLPRLHESIQGDVLDAIQLALVGKLNDAAVDGSWGFADGDLYYEPEAWWAGLDAPDAPCVSP